MDRHLIFRNYWWIAAIVGGCAALLSFCYGEEERVGLVGAVIAGTLGFCYFVQQQKLAETALFHQLFTGFNARCSAKFTRKYAKPQSGLMPLNRLSTSALSTMAIHRT